MNGGEVRVETCPLCTVLTLARLSPRLPRGEMEEQTVTLSTKAEKIQKRQRMMKETPQFEEKTTTKNLASREKEKIQVTKLLVTLTERALSPPVAARVVVGHDLNRLIRSRK